MSVANGTFTRTNSFGPGEDRCYPRFHIEAMEDHIASQREGRLICHDIEMVEIIMPANPYTRPDEKVTQAHRDRWPAEYKAFKDGITLATKGTPLEMWPLLRPAMIKELKYKDFRTVEDVARMDDHAIQTFGMGGRKLREAAIAFIDAAAESKLMTKLQGENERLENQVSELTTKVGQLSTLLEQVHGELQGLKNAPHPLATHIPGLSDPMEQMKQNQEPTGGSSSLDSLVVPKRRPGRPSNAEKAARAAAEGTEA